MYRVSSRWGFARLPAVFKRRELRLLGVALIMAALLWKIDRERLQDLLSRFDLLTGVLMMGINLVLTALFACRWWTIAAACGVVAPFRTFVRAIWLSQCVSELGPALVVGEVTRFQMLRAFGDHWGLAISQALDRLSGKLVLLLMVALLAPLYLRWYEDLPLGQLGVVTLMVVAAITVVVVLARRFWPTARLHPGPVIALSNPVARPAHYGLSVLIQTLLAGNLALAAIGLGASADTASRVLILAPLVLLGVGTLPGLVSDWGKREVVALAILSPAGLSAEQSLAVSLVYGFVHLLTASPAATLLLSGARSRVP